MKSQVQRAETLLVEVAGVADGLLDAAAEQGVEELGEGAGQADDGEGGEAGAPSSKSSSQLERSAGVHESLAGEDEDEIESSRCGTEVHPVLFCPSLVVPLIEVLLE